jgi:hypothetical protein
MVPLDKMARSKCLSRAFTRLMGIQFKNVVIGINKASKKC